MPYWRRPAAGANRCVYGHIQLFHCFAGDHRSPRLWLGDGALLHNNRLDAVVAGGVFLAVAALLVQRVTEAPTAPPGNVSEPGAELAKVTAR